MQDLPRCGWCQDGGLMQAYHDEEWGLPLDDDRMHFEYLMMEVMQCGLSWRLMLERREAFRRAFDGFDYERVADYGPGEEARILQQPGMIRSPRKIRAVIHNAGVYKTILAEWGSFAAYLASFAGNMPLIYPAHEHGGCARNALSDRISADLRRRGMKYLGSVTVYAHLQASGVINDHEPGCWRGRQLRERYEYSICEGA
jgi:DNA-3-methyladenine glycosylase I